MNKNELISKIAEQTGYTKKDTTIVVDTLCETIKDVIIAGDEVNIAGFGKFTVTERGERQGVNPATGEKLTIKASKTPKFKVSSTFKNAVNA